MLLLLLVLVSTTHISCAIYCLTLGGVKKRKQAGRSIQIINYQSLHDRLMFDCDLVICRDRNAN